MTKRKEKEFLVTIRNTHTEEDDVFSLDVPTVEWIRNLE